MHEYERTEGEFGNPAARTGRRRMIDSLRETATPASSSSQHIATVTITLPLKAPVLQMEGAN